MNKKIKIIKKDFWEGFSKDMERDLHRGQKKVWTCSGTAKADQRIHTNNNYTWKIGKTLPRSIQQRAGGIDDTNTTTRNGNPIRTIDSYERKN